MSKSAPVSKSVEGWHAGRRERWDEFAVWVFVALIVVKVLWGYWQRDLTFGDTASYFVKAVSWHQFGRVNIVWSPLYTAYYGCWLWITENARWATLLHRVLLIFLSTGLVAWIGLRTLPKILALGLATWWIALPIHYDTLYEVHLFGAVPILAIVAMAVSMRSEKWRDPLTLGVAVVTTLLIRNEYSILVVVLACTALWRLRRERNENGARAAWAGAGRYAICLVVAAALFALFFDLSYAKGDDLKRESSIKHTLNMCQVYAFGYQQRHAEWTKSPWTDCAGLMQETFGEREPTLAQMIAANPAEVARHFLWNLQLVRAGAEVLLTNATWSDNNPDYVPVLRQTLWPTLILAVTLVILLWGGARIRVGNDAYALQARAHFSRIAPLLAGLILVAIAVVLTQRPRPSYQLAQGAIYLWLVALCLPAFVPAILRWIERPAIYVAGTALLLLAPPYAMLPLGSKGGLVTAYYESLLPQASTLCADEVKWLATDYAGELSMYLCAPYRTSANAEPKIGDTAETFPTSAWTDPRRFVEEVGKRGYRIATIDVFFLDRFGKAGSCEGFAGAFADAGWHVANTPVTHADECIFMYVRN